MTFVSTILNQVLDSDAMPWQYSSSVRPKSIKDLFVLASIMHAEMWRQRALCQNGLSVCLSWRSVCVSGLAEACRYPPVRDPPFMWVRGQRRHLVSLAHRMSALWVL